MFNLKVRRENKSLNMQKDLDNKKIEKYKKENADLIREVNKLKDKIKDLHLTIIIQRKALEEIENETEINQYNSLENFRNKIKAILAKLPHETNITTTQM